MATKFYKCLTCGNVAVKVVDNRPPLFCCGAKMEELIPNTVDASNEKHVPVVTAIDQHTLSVKVGSQEHPMLPEHHIAFIYVETTDGGIRVDLKDCPSAEIKLDITKVVAVYEYCNLHGLWKTDLK
jgi:superoxide reductase